MSQIRLWLSRTTPVPIREQLRAQLMLGILSGRFRPGDRLPSVRHLARLLDIHPNTVSSVYRLLGSRGWVVHRPGSGVYVDALPRDPLSSGVSAFVEAWLEIAREKGFSLADLRAELDRAESHRSVPGTLVVLDPDPDLAHILAAEIAERLGRAVAWTGVRPGVEETLAAAAHVFVNQGHLPQVAALLSSRSFHAVKIKAMQELLEGRSRPPAPILIALVSRSQSVLSWGATLLSALGFGPDSVLLRDCARPGWHDGLGVCAIVAADVCAAREFASGPPPLIFRLVAEESLSEIEGLVTAQKP